MTRYHYGYGGRLEWSETIHDAEYLDDDIEAALGWDVEQNLICSGCGHPLDETTEDRDRAAWVAEPVTCWSCASRDRVEQAQKGARPPGVRYRTRNRAKTNEGVTTSE